jgi:hypothetical protein
MVRAFVLASTNTAFAFKRPLRFGDNGSLAFRSRITLEISDDPVLSAVQAMGQSRVGVKNP